MPNGIEQMPSGDSGGGLGEWVQEHKGAALAMGGATVLALIVLYVLYKKKTSTAQASNATGYGPQYQLPMYPNMSGFDVTSAIEGAISSQLAAQNQGAAGQGQDMSAQLNDQFSSLQNFLSGEFGQLGATLNQQSFNGQTTPTSNVPQASTPAPYGTIAGVTPSEPSGFVSGPSIPGVPVGSLDVQQVNPNPFSGSSTPFFSYQTGGATSPGASLGGVSVPAGASPLFGAGGTQVGWQSGNTSYPLHPVQYT